MSQLALTKITDDLRTRVDEAVIAKEDPGLKALSVGLA